jgi:glycosyltransferase involved in cell wall biosynthesis
MGYGPNSDAACWMTTQVWPTLCRTFKRPLRLVLAGSHPDASLVRLGQRKGIEVTGTLPDIGNLYAAAHLAVVPLRMGGGTRIKLLEAAAWQVPIVSTTIGAEGTNFRHGRELLIADSAALFAQSCNVLLRNPAFAKGLAERARMRINLDYSPNRWARQVINRVAALAS